MRAQGEGTNGIAPGAASHAEAAAGEVNALSTGEQMALAAVRGAFGPMSADELAAYNCARAREMAKAEARRAPSPQLDLDAAA